MRLFLLASLSLLAVLPWGVGAAGSFKDSPAAGAQSVQVKTASGRRASVAEFGAVGDGKTLNTERIQSAINQLASKGGGTLVVPRGVFLSGAIFLKPGVNQEGLPEDADAHRGALRGVAAGARQRGQG
jgi:hypothetical protein